VNNTDLDNTIEHVIAAARRAAEGELLLEIMGALHSCESVDQVWVLLGRLVEERSRKREPRPYVRKEALAKRNGKPKAAEAEKPEPERPDLELTPPTPLDQILHDFNEAESVERLLEISYKAGKLGETDKIVARAAYQKRLADLDRANR
jgi:hypothetical protein